MCVLELSTANSWEAKPSKLSSGLSISPGQTLAAWAPLSAYPLLAIVLDRRLHTGVGPSWESSLEPIGPPLPPSALQGLPDLTYRERVWSRGAPGFWWSPDASFLAYVVFPCTQVALNLVCGRPWQELFQTDCETVVKAGQSLPHFSLHVASFIKTKATNVGKGENLEVEETNQVILKHVGHCKAKTTSGFSARAVQHLPCLSLLGEYHQPCVASCREEARSSSFHQH